MLDSGVRMKNSPEDVLRAALALPPEVRAALAGHLLASLDEVDDDAEDAWRAEIEKRLADIDSGAVRAISWHEARRRIAG